MPTKVFAPRLGEGVEEVTITRWLKNTGDPVIEMEALLEVNTDKVDTEIPAPVSGILLEIFFPQGSQARVGDALAMIGEAGELASGRQLPAESGRRAAGRSKDLGFISPVVARMAAEHQLDLSQVRGSGLNGRITRNDVLDFLSSRLAEQPEQQGIALHPPPADQRWPDPQPAPPSTISTQAQAASPPESALLPHPAIRRAIAKRMVESKQTSPHVLTVMEADLSRLVAHRAENRQSFASDGVNLTYTAYFMQAIVVGLKACPVVNSSWSEEGILLHKDIHLGVAVSLGEDGLIVPVVKNAEALSLLGMARAVNTLSSRARARKLSPDEVRGGTFTLTNHGVSGSLFAFPVINQPQCGILGVGALQKRVVVMNDDQGREGIAIRPMVYLSFVFDHRILDGASADRFLAKVKETLEKW